MSLDGQNINFMQIVGDCNHNPTDAAITYTSTGGTDKIYIYGTDPIHGNESSIKPVEKLESGGIFAPDTLWVGDWPKMTWDYNLQESQEVDTQMHEWQVCPLCKGKGTWKFEVESRKWYSTSTAVVTETEQECHVCGGELIISKRNGYPPSAQE